MVSRRGGDERRAPAGRPDPASLATVGGGRSRAAHATTRRAAAKPFARTPRQMAVPAATGGKAPRPAGGKAPARATLRKGTRRVRPRRPPGALPPPDAAVAAGDAAVGRRLRVHWPAEGEWFAGYVASYDAATGRHRVLYDDGDTEDLWLAEEAVEWVAPPGAAQRPAPAAEGDTAAADASTARADAPPPEWPRVGDLLWGRVKGHGWWPGRVVSWLGERPSAGSVPVHFFDQTSGWVPRAECLPFEEHFEALLQSKRVPAFIRAANLAWAAWSQGPLPEEALGAKRQSPFRRPAGAAKRARLRTAGGALATDAGGALIDQPAALLPARLVRAGVQLGKPRGRRPAVRVVRRKSRALPRGFGDGVGLLLVGTHVSDVTGLAQRLDELKTRLCPLAQAAHASVAAQLSTLAQPGPRRPPLNAAAGSAWVSKERVRLMSQLEALARLPSAAAAPPPLPRSSAPPQPDAEPSLPQPDAAAVPTEPPACDVPLAAAATPEPEPATDGNTTADDSDG